MSETRAVVDTFHDERNYFSAKDIILRWKGGDLGDFLSALIAALGVIEQAKEKEEQT